MFPTTMDESDTRSIITVFNNTSSMQVSRTIATTVGGDIITDSQNGSGNMVAVFNHSKDLVVQGGRATAVGGKIRNPAEVYRNSYVPKSIRMCVFNIELQNLTFL